MPDTNEDHEKEENQEAENHVNGGDKPEEPQENQVTAEDFAVDIDEVMDKTRARDHPFCKYPELLLFVFFPTRFGSGSMKSFIPSAELLERLQRIASFDISPNAIQKVGFEDPEKQQWNDMYRVTWPASFQGFVQETTRKAMDEAIKEISPTSIGWASNTYQLRKGAVTSKNRVTLIVPLVKPSDDSAEILFKGGEGPCGLGAEVVST
ncbi:hypothetical protein PG984_016482 [Apiospora sp. TS-2023a]